MKSKLLFFAFSFFVLYASYASVVVPTKDASVNVVVTDSLNTINETTLKDALTAFRSLSHKERMFRMKEAKIAFKKYKAAKAKGDDVDTNTLLLAIIAILLPPLAVYLKEKEFNSKFWIDVLLCLLFFGTPLLYLTGIIFALIVVLS